MTEQLFELSHRPFIAPRSSTDGEGIYLNLWQDYMERRPEALDNILIDLCDTITQRDATVCASWMAFMGTNVGIDFTYAAKHKALRIAGEENSLPFWYTKSNIYRITWAEFNRRQRGVNSNFTLTEIIICTAIKAQQIVGINDFNSVTVRDYEIMDLMSVWWSTNAAEQIRSIAEPLIEAYKRKALSELFN